MRSSEQDLLTRARASEAASLEATSPEPVDHDESLIRWMLKLTPTERLEVLQDFVDAVLILRSGRKVTQ